MKPIEAVQGFKRINDAVVKGSTQLLEDLCVGREIAVQLADSNFTASFNSALRSSKVCISSALLAGMPSGSIDLTTLDIAERLEELRERGELRSRTIEHRAALQEGSCLGALLHSEMVAALTERQELVNARAMIAESTMFFSLFKNEASPLLAFAVREKLWLEPNPDLPQQGTIFKDLALIDECLRLIEKSDLGIFMRAAKIEEIILDFSLVKRGYNILLERAEGFQLKVTTVMDGEVVYADVFDESAPELIPLTTGALFLEQALPAIDIALATEKLSGIEVLIKTFRTHSPELVPMKLAQLLSACGYAYRASCAAPHLVVADSLLSEASERYIAAIKLCAELDLLIVEPGCLPYQACEEDMLQPKHRVFERPISVQEFYMHFPEGVKGWSGKLEEGISIMPDAPRMPVEFYNLPKYFEKQGFRFCPLSKTWS